MHSISDLTTFARKTKGAVPPQLVGASTTVVGNRMYLFGGRLVSLRRMVSDLYVFDLETFIWEKVEPSPDEEVPGARYFHSADSYNDMLVVFGGMGYVAAGSEELCVLNDVRVFDLRTKKWRPASPQATAPPDSPQLIPRSRYAHLSSVTSDRLFIIGGQDMTNVWLDDIHVFDLVKMAWIQRQDYPRHCGTYRSVAVAGKLRVRLPQEERKGDDMGLLGPPGSRFKTDGGPAASPTRVISDELVHPSYSTPPSADFPNDIMLYSNYNFTDVRRELEVISPQEPSGFSITDRSDAMTGVSLPPGLRFPTGAILGTHLIIAGTYLAHSYQSFSIWALDLHTMAWIRIDAGTTLTTGSWSRGVLWAAQNKFLIFGNRAGNLVEDYNRRLLSWEHVAYIDLEAFGIYQPPRLMLELRTQELGLAALEEGVLADFEVVCDDGRRIACSRKTLEDRWPWFAEQRRRYLKAARKALDTLPAPAQGDVPLPPRKIVRPHTAGATPSGDGTTLVDDEERADPRLMPRALHLSEPYSITLALLQYIYSLGLVTPLQHSPPVLSALLLLSTTYKMPHLESLVKHVMHKNLSPANSVGVYEVATLCDCQSLQIRALKVVMSSSRRPPQQNSTIRRDPPTAGGDRDHQGPNGQARPRGMSDATRLRENGGGTTSGNEGYTSSTSRTGGVVAANGEPSSVGRVQVKGTTRMPRRPATADSARGLSSQVRSGLSLNTSIVNGERKMSLPGSAADAQAAMAAVAASNPQYGRQVPVEPMSAVDSPATAPSVVVSRTSEDGPDGANATFRTRVRALTAPETDPQGIPKLDKKRGLLGRRNSGGPSRTTKGDPYATTTEGEEDELGVVSSTDASAASMSSTHETSDSDGEETYIGPETDIHSAFPTPPTHTAGPTAASADRADNLSPTRTPPSRSPPSTLSRSTASQAGWNVAPNVNGQARPPIRRKISDLSVSASSSSSQRASTASSAFASQGVKPNRRRAGSDATGSTEGPMTPPASLLGSTGNIALGGPFAMATSPTSAEFPGTTMRTLDRIDESAGQAPGAPPGLAPTSSIPDLRKQLQMQGLHLDVPLQQSSSSPLSPQQVHSRQASVASQEAPIVNGGMDHSVNGSSSRLASPLLRHAVPEQEAFAREAQGSRLGDYSRVAVPVQRTMTGTSSGDSNSSMNGGPIPSTKLDKAVEKARKNLEKLEQKARERAEKEARDKQMRDDKKRKKVAAQPSPQEMFERGRYMSVLGFR